MRRSNIKNSEFKTPFKNPSVILTTVTETTTKPATIAPAREFQLKPRDRLQFKRDKLPRNARKRMKVVDKGDDNDDSDSFNDFADLQPESGSDSEYEDEEYTHKNNKKNNLQNNVNRQLGMKKLSLTRRPLAPLNQNNSQQQNDNASPPVKIGCGGNKVPNDSFKKLFRPFKMPTFTSKLNENGGVDLFDNRPVLGGAVTNHDEEEDDSGNSKKIQGKTISEILGYKQVKFDKVHVVVDPLLGKKLRPHQVEGVKFLYNCTTGKTFPDAFGCIMADEMGLGKTLQCIALLWTLLRQSPEPNKGTIDKCIIVCPSSLVHNWANELDVLVKDLRHFSGAQGRMITQPGNIEELKNTEIGLLLCDEGHRLKNSNSLTFQTLNSLNVQRRVILSGTPIQNDLSEYFSLLNFANPGLLGTPNEFRRNYENPILRGRDANASEKDREISDQKLSDLWGVVSKFIIRRSNDILSKYLPVKYEYVVFCRLSKFQASLYNFFITSPEIQKLLRGAASQPLKAITILKKLCNHPDLLDLPRDLQGSEECYPTDYSIKEKLRCVRPEMLEEINKNSNDKIVLISNYTQTLDIFEKLCRNRKYGCLRLDGSMAIKKRQSLVSRFNDPKGKEFVFLLSSKAGGCGLNLIGANRLVLFDPDWNPASDQQALARIWRDGQKKECFIYRFIATGTIEEKIFQRQSHKQLLSSCVVDEDADVERHFSAESLRQLFQFDPNTMCDTHSTFKCYRCVKGVQRIARNPGETMNYGDTSSWDHFTGGDDLLKIHDEILKLETGKGVVSYAFQYKSH
nr:1780_t:CDS:10 [Entrophospora candida]